MPAPDDWLGSRGTGAGLSFTEVKSASAGRGGKSCVIGTVEVTHRTFSSACAWPGQSHNSQTSLHIWYPSGTQPAKGWLTQRCGRATPEFHPYKGQREERAITSLSMRVYCLRGSSSNSARRWMVKGAPTSKRSTAPHRRCRSATGVSFPAKGA